ncbi:MAG: TIGR00730 family Rossman fold protein [Rhodanobacteraceae bacterium]|nr:MAG: TIGR00730 family Rossman fold protein [Rhodanobacteraceae bacterium]
MRICVYCASSNQADPRYREAAFRLGELLAGDGHSIVYGGGSAGSMGAVANGALSKGGEVIGILPRFMADLEWGHPGLTHLEMVDDMQERKRRLLTGSDAVVALPGGCGTLEELFEAITLKRLGLYFNPIVLLDTLGYWQPLDAFLRTTIEQHFMNPEHALMWSRVAAPEDVLPAIRNAPKWDTDARDRAVVR